MIPADATHSNIWAATPRPPPPSAQDPPAPGKVQGGHQGENLVGGKLHRLQPEGLEEPVARTGASPTSASRPPSTLTWRRNWSLNQRQPHAGSEDLQQERRCLCPAERSGRLHSEL